jgi:hypothetical protein
LKKSESSEMLNILWSFLWLSFFDTTDESQQNERKKEREQEVYLEEISSLLKKRNPFFIVKQDLRMQLRVE